MHGLNPIFGLPQIIGEAFAAECPVRVKAIHAQEHCAREEFSLVCLYGYTQANQGNDISNDMKFDKNTWIKGTMRQKGQMVNYLLDSIGLVDKTKEEIKNILENPDTENNVC